MTITEITPTELTVRKVAGRIGAQIDGVRLSGDLPGPVVAAIRQALLAHKVVFFRDQGHLTDDEQVEFGRQLGTVTTAHPTVPAVDNNSSVLNIDSGNGGGRANAWHTDVTFVDQPPAASILRAVIIPAYGGDTVWANTVTAYADLPDELRVLADRLWAVHTNTFDYARPTVAAQHGGTERDASYAAVFASTEYDTLHPVVRVHPETGERSLLLGGFARQIQGLSTTQSGALQQVFHDVITRLDNTVRWQWRQGDVAIWDNRATQHYAINDYGDQHRLMRRITVAGDRPVNVAGESSQSLRGDASTYYQVA
jgi:alpha-ketoglutarate-dependent sulfate ester dioxygenase